MNKKIILATSLIAILGTSLISLGTYSAFSSSKNKKINLDTSDLKIDSKILDFETYSNGIKNKDTTFKNGGSFDFTLNETTNTNSVLSLTNLSMNDELKFNVWIKNNNNFSTRVKLENLCLDGFEFYSKLDINSYSDNWFILKPNEEKTIPVSIKYKYDNSMENKNYKSSKIDFKIKAVQLGDELYDDTLNSYKLNDEKINADVVKNSRLDLNLMNKNESLKIKIPNSRLDIPSSITIDVKSDESSLSTFNDKQKISYDFSQIGIKDGEENISVSLFVGKDLHGIKISQDINGILKEINEYDYNLKEGFVTFEINELSKIIIEANPVYYFYSDSNENLDIFNQLNNTINSVPNDTRIVLGNEFDSLTIDDKTGPLIINDKNITLVGLNEPDVLGETIFNVESGIDIIGDSNVVMENMVMNSNNYIFNVKDNSKLDIYGGKYLSNLKDVPIVISTATTLGVPSVNIYDGEFTSKEVVNPEECYKPLFLKDKDLDVEQLGNITVFSGTFNNFNPAEFYYNYGNDVIYKSILNNGTFSAKVSENNNLAKGIKESYKVGKLEKSQYYFNGELSNYLDWDVIGYEGNFKLKTDLWFSPYITNKKVDTVLSKYPSNTGTKESINIDLDKYSMNLSANDFTIKESEKPGKIISILDLNNDNLISITSSHTFDKIEKSSINVSMYNYNKTKQVFNGYGIAITGYNLSDYFTLSIMNGVFNDKNTIYVEDPIAAKVKMKVFITGGFIGKDIETIYSQYLPYGFKLSPTEISDDYLEVKMN